MRWLLLLLIIAAVSCLGSGCAAVFDGSTDTLTATSSPSNADVEIDGRMMGKTPLVVDLSDARQHHVTIRLDGQERNFTLHRSAGAGWIILDILMGLLPVIIDGATGDWFGLDPTEVHAQFDAPGRRTPTAPSGHPKAPASTPAPESAWDW